MRIMHVIADLGVGGAELMLSRLSEAHTQSGAAEVCVVSLGSVGKIGEDLCSKGIEVEALGLTGFAGLLGATRQLAARIRKWRPDVIQTWLYHADLIGGLASRLAGTGQVVWNLRCTQPGVSRRTNALMKFNAALSRSLPASIIACGDEAGSFHIQAGYDPGRMTTIPNGFDIERYALAPFSNAADRIQLVALGRSDPLKDYQTMLTGFALAAEQNPALHLAIYGRGVDSNPSLIVQAEQLRLGGRLTLNPEVSDVRVPIAAADGLCLSSYAEGFPNVLGEAMLMGRPCISTNAGDAAMIVGSSGWIVPTRDPAALGEAMLTFAAQTPAQRQAMGLAAREHILANFELGAIAGRYLDHYRAVLTKAKD